MLTDKPGEIAPGLFLLGSQQNLMYLVRGEQTMVISGGMSWLAAYLEEQLAEIKIGAAGIDYLVIQHAHFDHVGAVPFMKRKYPAMKVLGTESARATLSKDKVIQYMDVVNSAAVEQFGLKERCAKFNLTIDGIAIDQVVNNSSVIKLGKGLEVNFIETPGHSPCALVVYIPALKALFPTDSAPCPIGGIEIDKLARPSPQYNYGLYLKSLERLVGYDIEICAFDHYGAVLGEDARQVLVNGMKLCRQYEKHVLDMYQESGDIEKVARQVASEMMAASGFEFSSGELMVPVGRAVVRNILKYLGAIDAH